MVHRLHRVPVIVVDSAMGDAVLELAVILVAWEAPVESEPDLDSDAQIEIEIQLGVGDGPRHRVGLRE